MRRYYLYGLSQFREEEVGEQLQAAAESFYCGDIVCLPGDLLRLNVRLPFK